MSHYKVKAKDPRSKEQHNAAKGRVDNVSMTFDLENENEPIVFAEFCFYRNESVAQLKGEPFMRRTIQIHDVNHRIRDVLNVINDQVTAAGNIGSDIIVRES